MKNQFQLESTTVDNDRIIPSSSSSFFSSSSSSSTISNTTVSTTYSSPTYNPYPEHGNALSPLNSSSLESASFSSKDLWLWCESQKLMEPFSTSVHPIDLLATRGGNYGDHFYIFSSFIFRFFTFHISFFFFSIYLPTFFRF